jgi:hypothetical protein
LKLPVQKKLLENMKSCIKCGAEIPEARLKALPNAKTCIDCSDTGRVAGFPIISGKTTYSELVITDQKTAEELFQKQERKGSGISEGIKGPAKDQ